jgi:hypothetical protein
MGKSMSPKAVQGLIEADAGWSVTYHYGSHRIIVGRSLGAAASPEIAGWLTTGALTTLLGTGLLDWGEYVTPDDGSEAYKIFRRRGVLCYCACGHLPEKHVGKAGRCSVDGCGCEGVEATE